LIQVTFDPATKAFVCKCAFDERHVPKQAGFEWNPMTREWETRKLSKAVRLRDYFDKTAEKQFNQKSIEISPWAGGILFPKHQRLKKYQERGARFALERNRSYIAFEQGLGKTPTAVTVINSYKEPTLIICPPFLVDNWKRELKNWLVDETEPCAIQGKDVPSMAAKIVILPDSLLDRESVHEFIHNRDFGMLVVDEAHRFKNFEAKRTKNLFERIAPRIPKIVCLSGTPMPNRPSELYPVLSSLAHDTIEFMSFHEYAIKFCNAFKNEWGWVYSGACNLGQLKKQVIGRFMLRETKAEVLPELEPKEERIISLSGRPQPGIQTRDKKLKLKLEGKILENERLGELAEHRKNIGIAKILIVFDYVEDLLESTEESILLFAWHVDVIDGLFKALVKWSPEVISGSTPVKHRQLIVDKFQAGKTRVLIAQIQTMVGYNLTKATRCVFAEYSWSPADNEQASDRAHRIGQKDSVIVDYLVMAKTIDEQVIETIQSKRKNINQLLLKGVKNK
jgi:SWI/SNF-related matrix-associated actin-dependent regulator 1 of chromatin subfamily A